MKNIFNKVDPKFLECTTGVCEHANHNLNGAYWVILLSIVLYRIYKTKLRKHNDA
jgi:hypothetical protein